MMATAMLLRTNLMRRKEAAVDLGISAYFALFLNLSLCQFCSICVLEAEDEDKRRSQRGNQDDNSVSADAIS
jgi:hypothetical protein